MAAIRLIPSSASPKILTGNSDAGILHIWLLLASLRKMFCRASSQLLRAASSTRSCQLVHVQRSKAALSSFRMISLATSSWRKALSMWREVVSHSRPSYTLFATADTQVQKIHNQINQYPRKSLISYLGVSVLWSGCPGAAGVSDDSRASISDSSLLVGVHSQALPPQSGHLFHDLSFVFVLWWGRFRALLAAGEWSFVPCCLSYSVW